MSDKIAILESRASQFESTLKETMRVRDAILATLQESKAALCTAIRERDEALALAAAKSECHATNLKIQDHVAGILAKVTKERDENLREREQWTRRYDIEVRRSEKLVEALKQIEADKDPLTAGIAQEALTEYYKK